MLELLQIKIKEIKSEKEKAYILLWFLSRTKLWSKALVNSYYSEDRGLAHDVFNEMTKFMD